MPATKALLLRSFLSLVIVWSPGALGALAGQAEAPRDCARWIQKGLGVLLAGGDRDQSSAPPISDPAGNYLALMDLGLLNLGPETPALLENLKRATMSRFPTNPFLNLKSSLAKALADRVEPLVAQVQPKWSSILDRIKAQVSEAQAEQGKRDSDQQATRRFQGLVPVPIEDPQDFSGGLSWLEYVGQTDEDLIFAKYSQEPGRGAFYRVSKATPKLQLIARVNLQHRGLLRVTKWVRDGLIFGIGVFDSGFQQEGKQHQQRLFRLDPKTSEFQWAESWDDEKHEFRRVQSTDTVVGIELDEAESGKGRIYRFDEKLLRFVPSELIFSANEFKRATHQNGILLTGFYPKVAEATDPEIVLGFNQKTDGLAIVKLDDLSQWQDWTISDWIKSRPLAFDRSVPNPKINVTVNEDVPTYFKDEDERQKAEHRSRKNISYHFPAPKDFSENHLLFQYESLKRAEEILYLAKYNTSLLKLMIVDRATWSEKPVRLAGGPSIEKEGAWRILRNRQNEILLLFLYFAECGEVALWKFNPSTDTFEFQVHETYDNPRGGVLGARIDYDTKQFIAWTVDDQLLVQLPVALDRKGVQP